MKVENFINGKSKFHFAELREFIDTYGIEKVKKKDLDKIINKYGFDVTTNAGFLDLYTIKCAESSGKLMTWLTIVIGILSIVVSTVSLLKH